MKNKKHLKDIVNKIAELEATIYARQMTGDLDGAMRAKKALRFAKSYFKKEARKGGE